MERCTARWSPTGTGPLGRRNPRPTATRPASTTSPGSQRRGVPCGRSARTLRRLLGQPQRADPPARERLLAPLPHAEGAAERLPRRRRCDRAGGRVGGRLGQPGHQQLAGRTDRAALERHQLAVGDAAEHGKHHGECGRGADRQQRLGGRADIDRRMEPAAVRRAFRWHVPASRRHAHHRQRRPARRYRRAVPTNIIAVGTTGGGGTSLVLHWNGASWLREAAPDAALAGAAAVGPNTFWAVGNRFDLNAYEERTFTMVGK